MKYIILFKEWKIKPKTNKKCEFYIPLKYKSSLSVVVI